MEYTPNTKNYEAFIRELAKELAYNYFGNSFGDNERKEIHTKEIFKDTKIAKYFEFDRNSGNRRRNILVIGAGASFDAFKGVPVGKMLTDQLSEEFISPLLGIKFMENRVKQEIYEILKLTDKDTLDFENFLYLLSSFFVTQKDLRQAITNMTEFRYSNNLFYEIVAHLLKHGFIDIVINFNFEEMLDHAIEQEVGKGNYHYILSDGHCVSLEELLVDGRLKVPIYIKPHGTFSHKTSLRFTKRHYLDLPTDIRNMLISLVSGKVTENISVDRVNLICVGFALESLEFNDILNENLPKHAKIFQIDFQNFDKKWKSQLLEKRLKIFYDKAKIAGNSKPYNLLSTQFFNKDEDENKKNYLTQPLGEIFSVLWRKIHSFFREDYSPRSIARHEIISYLFYDEDLSQGSMPSLKSAEELRGKMRKLYEESSDYFKDRVLVEIALALNRNNGIVDIIELLEGKVGHYYQLYSTFCKPHEKLYSIYELMNEFTIERRIDERQQIKASEEFMYSRNIFRINTSDVSIVLKEYDNKRDKKKAARKRNNILTELSVNWRKAYTALEENNE